MRGYIDTSAGQLHYRREGDDGPDIVLFHCANFSSNLYERTLPILGQRMRAWAFDAPGVGMSDAPPEPTMVQMAVWLGEAIDALGIEHPVVGGLHTGCRIALEMAKLRGGDYFAAAVLMGIGPIDESYREKHGFRGPHLNLTTDLESTQWQQAIDRYHLIYPDQNPPTEPDGWLQHLFALSSVSKIVPRRLPWPGGASEGAGLEQVLRTFPSPLLILNTPEDCFSSGDREAATWNDHAELRMIDGIGPHMMLREPQRYADEVVSFLERCGVLTA